MKIAYMGFGKSAKRYHIPYVLEREMLQIKTVFTPNYTKADMDEYQQYGISFTKNIMDVLEDTEIELVSICTPPASHFSLAKQCLEYGHNVLVEKPFCETVAEAKILFDLAKAKGLKIMAYQNRRFDGDFILLQQILKEGQLGRIVEVETHFDYYRPEFVAEFSKNPFNGALYGLGVHSLDQMVALFGKPEKVFYDIKAQKGTPSNDDYFEVQLFYADNLKVIVKTSHLVCLPGAKITVHGVQGSFQKTGMDKQERDLKNNIFPGMAAFGADDISDYGKLSQNDENSVEVIKTPIGDYGAIYDNIYQAIRTDALKIVSDEQTLTVLGIIEQGFKQPSPVIVEYK